jgi:hypothetical protein
MSSALITLLVIALAVAAGIALAYLPMRLLLAHIARNVREFIQRQRERRSSDRDTPDRRKREAETPAPTPTQP